MITPEEKLEIESSNRSNKQEARDDFDMKWTRLFTYKQLWGLMSARLFIDSAWYFIIFWLPKYLADARGLDIKEIGYYAWIPYAFAGGGSLIGGWFSSYLIRKNVSLDHSRKISLAIATVIMPASLLITSSPLAFVIVFFGMALFGHQAFSTLVQTIVIDLFPKKVIGSAAGLVGGVGVLGAMIFSLAAGYMVQYFGYSPVFIVVGLMHPIAFLIILFFVGKIKMVQPLKTINRDN